MLFSRNNLNRGSLQPRPKSRFFWEQHGSLLPNNQSENSFTEAAAWGPIGTCPLGFISFQWRRTSKMRCGHSYGAQTLDVSSVLSAHQSMWTRQPGSHCCVWTPAAASALLQMFSDGLLTEVSWLNVPDVCACGSCYTRTHVHTHTPGHENKRSSHSSASMVLFFLSSHFNIVTPIQCHSSDLFSHFSCRLLTENRKMQIPPPHQHTRARAHTRARTCACCQFTQIFTCCCK